MCFTPLVSITTAVIEFVIVSYLFYRIKDKKLYPLAIFVFLLGLYQFTEFMLCKTNNTILWARIGFASYTFLPFTLYHFFINATGKKNNQIIYIIPILFSIIALFYPDFINYTSCNTFHVTVESLIFNNNRILMFFYMFSYLFFPIYGVYIFSKKMKYLDLNLNTKLGVVAAPFTLLAALLYYLLSAIYENNQIQTWLNTSVIIIVSVLLLILLSLLFIKRSKKIFYQINSLILATTGVTVIILYYIVPNITLNYSSIFCHFALLYGVASVLLINSLDGKIPSE
jgi:hypothetical protein